MSKAKQVQVPHVGRCARQTTGLTSLSERELRLAKTSSPRPANELKCRKTLQRPNYSVIRPIFGAAPLQWHLSVSALGDCVTLCPVSSIS